MLLSLKQYEEIAKKILYSKYPSFAKNIVNDYDSFGTIVTKIIESDKKWDGRGTIEGYRKSNAIYAIKSLGRKPKKEIKKLSLDNTNSCDKSYGSIIPNKSKTPDEEIMHEQRILRVLSALQDEDSPLSDMEKGAVDSYFYGQKTYHDISKEIGFSLERTRQIVFEALKKIKGYCSGY
jgi:hypothetical protein